MLPVGNFDQLTNPAMASASPILLSTHQSAPDKLLVDNSLASLLNPSASTSSSNSKYPPGQQLLSDDERKEQFEMFLGILIKYLGKKDPVLQERAKEIVQECQAAYSKSGIQSKNGIVLYLRIQSRLQEIVTVKQWKRAQMYLQIHLKNKRERAAAKTQQRV
ncbi:hypothetical protein MPSEU_000436300 [Mayamaea pseudoterrestris]|nr:hypothetical protein MPSEU_000436300 [Mayamaea pseudoterrestris]